MPSNKKEQSQSFSGTKVVKAKDLAKSVVSKWRKVIEDRKQAEVVSKDLADLLEGAVNMSQPN